MARPNSKYFTPVIKRLLDARRHESIVIDQNFKASLRARVLAKAADSAPPKRGFDFNRIAEFFGRNRTALAIVPSLLLLAIVAVSALRMPVDLKSDVVVPTGNESGKSEAVPADAIKTAGVTSQDIKTFPGRGVLPSSYFAEKMPVIEMKMELPPLPPEKAEAPKTYATKIETTRAVLSNQTAEALPVYYNSDFSEDEKTVFENDVIAVMIKNLEVSYVSVLMASDKVVNVEVYIKNGEVMTKNFMKDSDSNVWNAVRYVENYYYDNSLQYESSMRHIPRSATYPMYNSYDYPYEYQYLREQQTVYKK